MGGEKMSYFLKSKNFKTMKPKKINQKYKNNEINKIDNFSVDDSDEDILKYHGGRLIVDETRLYDRKEIGDSHGKNIIYDNEVMINSRTYSRKTGGSRWSSQENDLFFDALVVCGTEFSLIAAMFPEKSRKQIKNKYIKETKSNNEKIRSCLKKHSSFDRKRYEDLKRVNNIN